MSELFPDGAERLRKWRHIHTESVGPGRILSLLRTGPWLFEGEESFPALGGMKQSVRIADFAEFGRGLVIDGQVQLAESIDPLYTNALVFPSALMASSRAEWLIVGGGDGAAAREALRFSDTESVELVDISRMVIDRTQELIPSFWQDAQHDGRLRIECRDAWQVLTERANAGRRVNIILFDLTDPKTKSSRPFRSRVRITSIRPRPSIWLPDVCVPAEFSRPRYRSFRYCAGKITAGSETCSGSLSGTCGLIAYRWNSSAIGSRF